jgi:hypothetical protein
MANFALALPFCAMISSQSAASLDVVCVEYAFSHMICKHSCWLGSRVRLFTVATFGTKWKTFFHQFLNICPAP